MYYAVISFLLLGFATGAVILFQRRKRESAKNEIHHLFLRFWSKKEEDRLPAWQCVRYELMRRGSEENELRYVDKQIRNIDKQEMLSCFCVAENGEIRREERR